MAAAKKTAPEEPELVEASPEQALPSNFEFVNRVPTRLEVAELLGQIPPVWGVAVQDFIDYIQALPQTKKVKKPHPQRPNLMIDESVSAYTLYVSVGGRQQMLREAQEAHGWRVDYRPEPVTPTGIPGYLSFHERLVYRTYVDIWQMLGENGMLLDEPRLLGTRSGTAWVPEIGGKNAAGSNPYEKVETSALGRAIGAWGFGVLPGSGIATVEEMAAIAGNDQYQRQQQAGQQQERRETREELLEATLGVIERYRSEAGKAEAEMDLKIATTLNQRLGIKEPMDPETGLIRWELVKDGQLVLLRNMIQEGLKALLDAKLGE